MAIFVGWVGAQTAISAGSLAALQSMASRAGVIFAGTVESVARMDAAGYVDVRFRVEEPVRGCRKGVYVLREWAGLWNGPARYRVGQRRLMLLLPRGPSGMSSPVDGLGGAIPLVGAGVPAIVKGGIVPVDMGAGIGAAQVDLRWVDASALRAAAKSPVGVHAEGLGPVGGAWTAVAPLSSESGKPLDYPTVVGVLKSAGSADGVR